MKNLLIFLFLIISSVSFAQKEDNIWYFGVNAGLDFTTGSPIAISDGQIVTYDCTASICDRSTGALLFYSDGNTVWNKNHTIMPNGTGLIGGLSAGQTVAIVRNAEAIEKYYIFTVPQFGSGGLYYSVVDMNLNGGNGDVTATKNVLLHNSVTEKLAVFHHTSSAGSYYWIVSHDYGTSNFRAYKLDGSGLNTTPVVSSIGTVASSGSGGNAAMGQLVFNQQGNMLANANYDDNSFELFNFNSSTGVITNPIKLSGFTRAWGLCFSADGMKLYATAWTYSYVKQFDLSTYSQAAIMASVQTIGNATSPDPLYKAGYMQIGPDKKIYIAKYSSDYLATISYPDALGSACGFADTGMYLNGKISRAGLLNGVIYEGRFTEIHEVENNLIAVTYPNPSNSKLNIKFEKEIGIDFAFSIFNQIGENVVVPTEVSGSIISLSTSTLPSGEYFFLITNHNWTSKGKFTVID
jgi:hypothetical protein